MLLCYVARFPGFLRLLASGIFFHPTARGNSSRRHPHNAFIMSSPHAHSSYNVDLAILPLQPTGLGASQLSWNPKTNVPLGFFATLNTPIVMIMLLSAELLGCARTVRKVSQMSISWLHRPFFSADGGTLRTAKEAAF